MSDSELPTVEDIYMTLSDNANTIHTRMASKDDDQQLGRASEEDDKSSFLQTAEDVISRRRALFDALHE